MYYTHMGLHMGLHGYGVNFGTPIIGWSLLRPGDSHDLEVVKCVPVRKWLNTHAYCTYIYIYIYIYIQPVSMKVYIYIYIYDRICITD